MACSDYVIFMHILDISTYSTWYTVKLVLHGSISKFLKAFLQTAGKLQTKVRRDWGYKNPGSVSFTISMS